MRELGYVDGQNVTFGVGKDYAATGMLMSYGAKYPELFRHAAIFVDKISQGRQARRSPCRATHDLRAGDQSQDRQGVGIDDPAVNPCPRRRGHPVSGPPGVSGWGCCSQRLAACCGGTAEGARPEDRLVIVRC